jgi:acyl-CoA thioesterase FadM
MPLPMPLPLSLSVMGWLGPVAASAGVLADGEARAVRAVIEAQLDAFAVDDAERAYSYASAAIRAQFTDAATFMTMVRSGYPMVVRPASVTFFQPSRVDGAVLQKVQLRDREGRLWQATYQLEQQTTAGWRINGCVVVPDTGKSLT